MPPYSIRYVAQACRLAICKQCASGFGYGALALLRQGFAAQKRSVTEDELEQHRQFFLAFYREHLSVHSRPFPHAVSMLETLQAQGYELGVCTNKPHDLAVRLLDDLGLRAYFTGVCGYADDGVRKPDKKLLLRTLQRMNIKPSRDSVMVGDSLADAQAAQGCNLRFVGVSFGYGTLEAVDAPVDAIIDDLAELPDMLQKI